MDLSGESPLSTVRERVEDFMELCDFHEKELPALFERWEQRHRQRRGHDGGY